MYFHVLSDKLGTIAGHLGTISLVLLWGGGVVVGNEARELRSQEQIMEGLEWLVNHFRLCPAGSTGGQQRFGGNGITR